MAKFKLDYDRILQANFELGSANLLFVFQVNCPGCLLYGFPQMEWLDREYGNSAEPTLLGETHAVGERERDVPQAETSARFHPLRERDLRILGISTAFEDFEYNTAANVELLIANGQTIGATKRAIGERYQGKISFPIATDRLTTGMEIATPENLKFMCQQIAGYESMALDRQERLQQQLIASLSRSPIVAATFTLNQLPGTPSFILVDRDLEILDRWFGHIPDAEVIDRIAKIW